jgi:hypothetical protein
MCDSLLLTAITLLDWNFNAFLIDCLVNLFPKTKCAANKLMKCTKGSQSRGSIMPTPTVKVTEAIKKIEYVRLCIHVGGNNEGTHHQWKVLTDTKQHSKAKCHFSCVTMK